MAKRPSIEEQIDALEQLGTGEPTTAARLALVKGLRSKVGLVVAAAADAAAELSFASSDREDIDTAMAAAFATLSELAVKRDPLCRGKHALARAAASRGVFVDEIFAAGVVWVQMEPVWGGSQDTAADLRATCGLAYSELYHPEAINVLVVLLADPERNSRAGAAHALGNSGRLEAIPLLRFKALVGDEDIEVFSATVRALLVLEPHGAIDFLRRFLVGSSNVAEATALCLGESRSNDAFSPLKQWALELENREVGYLALSLLRSETATEFLIEEIATADDDNVARAAAKALAAFLHDPALADRVDAAEKRRKKRKKR